MTINPIFKRELRTSSRSLWTPLLLTMFNLILAFVALTSMSININQVRITAEIRYSSFLSIFRFVAIIEFILVLFIMPALSSGSISGEREKKTLDIMLTTKMTPGSIVVGKLLSSLSSVMLLVISSAPILALVFVYGGVKISDIALLLVSYLISAFLAGAIGLCMSALSRRTVMATAETYIAIMGITLGSIALNAIIRMIVQNGANPLRDIDAYGIGLLSINPLAGFCTTIGRITGDQTILANIVEIMGYSMTDLNTSKLLIISFVVQSIVAVILIMIAARAITPIKNVNKK